MDLYIGAYHGQSLVSKGIKVVTWGEISHVSLINPIGVTIEAWHKGGVQLSETPWVLHTPGTKISLFRLAYNGERVWEKALKEVGEEYDFKALLGFIPMLRQFHKNNKDKWFCSELVSYACDLNDNRSKYQALFNDRVAYHKIDPSYLCSSPNLFFVTNVHNIAEFHKVLRNY